MRFPRYLCCVLVALAVLPLACAAQNQQAGAPYDASIEATFLQQCNDANKVPDQRALQVSVCKCALLGVEKAYTQQEFVLIDAALANGTAPPRGMLTIMNACVDQVLGHRKT